MTAPAPAPSPRRSRPPGPELIGAVLAVVVVAIVATTAFAMGAPAASEPPRSPGPNLPSAPTTASPSPLVDPGAVELLKAVNERLVAFGDGLQRELDRANLRTNEVASLIRQVNATVALGTDAVAALNGAQGEDEPGGRLAAIYGSIADSATQTLRASIANDADYRVGASVIVKLIAGIPAIQAELEALAEGPPPSPSTAPPSPPVSASPPASSAPPATSPPPVTPVPSGGSAPPSAVPGSPEPSVPPDEQIENGGFEAGVGPPWALYVAPGASATLVPDPLQPATGMSSARIDIAISSAAFSGVSLRQPGLRLEAGRLYTLSLWVRAEVARDIRIRIGSTAGASYLARTAPATPAWVQVVLPFTAPVTDANASLEIDLGRSDETTWVDTVSFRPATGS